MTADITKAAGLAESLRAMARSVQKHRDEWRPHHYKEPLSFVRAGDLSDAADLIERLNAPAVLLTDEQLRAAYYSVDSGLDSSRTGIREERLRAVQAAVLAANGRAVQQ
jgi:hypothetical protein